MPTQNIHVVTEPGTVEEAFEQLAKLQKTLRYLLNGNLDFENVRVKGLTAETIDVDELSAITANLGHILAGIIESVEIYGSLISTNRTGYPRAVMSNTQNHFRAEADANRYISMDSFDLSTGSPTLTWRSPSGFSQSNMTTGYSLSSDRDIILASFMEMLISASNIYLIPNSSTGEVKLPAWSQVRNNVSGQTLQQALDNLQTSISGLYTYAASLDARIAALGG
ncbi:hypothetical protein ACX93W_26595 [Paenibacillus sp. CAU 1782]